MRKAMEVMLGKEVFRIVYASPETGHMHLIVEAERSEALARGMQSFKIAAAKRPVDFFSSGPTFQGWKEGPVPLPKGYEPLPVAKPKGWLLREGWRRAGEVSLRDEPR